MSQSMFGSIENTENRVRYWLAYSPRFRDCRSWVVHHRFTFGHLMVFFCGCIRCACSCSQPLKIRLKFQPSRCSTCPSFTIDLWDSCAAWVFRASRALFTPPFPLFPVTPILCITREVTTAGCLLVRMIRRSCLPAATVRSPRGPASSPIPSTVSRRCGRSTSWPWGTGR